MQITAILIAAGLSSRMKGPNKLLQDIGGNTLIQHSASQLINSNADEVIIVTGRDREKIESELSEFNVQSTRFKVIHNPSFEKGMTTSIQAGLNAVHNADAIMVCLSDMPELDTDDYNGLMNSFRERGGHGKIMVPFNNERRGNPVIFGSSFFGQIKEHKEPNGCSSIVKANKDKLFRLETSSSHYFFDIDTPETLKAYLSRVK